MNKNFRVITINGIRGMLLAAFVVFGLIAGFIVSPGWVCMQIWNSIFEEIGNVSLMNIYQGIILWAIIALSLYALNNKRALIGFGSYPGLSPNQIKDIMDRAKQTEELKKDFVKDELKEVEDNEVSEKEELRS